MLNQRVKKNWSILAHRQRRILIRPTREGDVARVLCHSFGIFARVKSMSIEKFGRLWRSARDLFLSYRLLTMT